MLCLCLSDGFEHQPGEYTEVFRALGVTDVVRLNEASTYDARAFFEQDMTVHDLFFEDCTLPSAHIVKRFLDIMDAASGWVAVHCLAGLSV